MGHSKEESFSSSMAKVQDTSAPCKCHFGPIHAAPRAVKTQEGAVKGGFCDFSNIPRLLKCFSQSFSEHCQDKQTRPPRSAAPSPPQQQPQHGSCIPTASLAPQSKPWSVRRDFYFPKLPWDNLDNLDAQERSPHAEVSHAG